MPSYSLCTIWIKKIHATANTPPISQHQNKTVFMKLITKIIISLAKLVENFFPT